MPRILFSRLSKPRIKEHDKFYDSTAWRRKAKQIIRAANSLCFYCLLKGFKRIGNICDHQLSRKLYPELQWEDTNLKCACRTCDQTKRQIESQCYDRVTLMDRLTQAGYYMPLETSK